MLQSKLSNFIRKEFPKDEEAYNAQILIRAGFIDKLMAGVYSYLPLGLRVIKRIEKIVRQRMDEIGAQELLMPVLHPKENWQKTGRWEKLDVLFKVKAQEDKEYALGPTHEEIIVPLSQKTIFSYKDLPFGLYQIQTKLRNEPRAKSGILRGREFIMKDLYSFHTNEESLNEYYQMVEGAYAKIFNDFGIGDITVKTYSSGGSFSKYSHEFQTILENGEDTIYVCQKCRVAVNREIIEEQKSCPVCQSTNLEETKASETANIFKLMTKYSDPFQLSFKDSNGENKNVIMGCYGMGISRIMGILAEIFHDEKGLIWPKSVAPFNVHLIVLHSKDEESNKDILKLAQKVYDELNQMGVETLYDDRVDKSPGEKFAESDLIGIPVRLVVSQKTNGKIEFKLRNSQNTEIIDFSDLTKYVKNK